MVEHDIARAAVLPLVSPLAWDHPVMTGYVLEQTKPHRTLDLPNKVQDKIFRENARKLILKL